MNKTLCIISCPIDCYSGYSSRSRDLVKAIIELKGKEYEIIILSQRWGDCSFGFIEDNIEEWGFLKEYIKQPIPNIQPDIFIQISVPNEFQKIGKWNIGITAGIESTVCHHDWIAGCNRMDEIWVSSTHSKKVFEDTKYEQKDQFGRLIGVLKLEKPIYIIHEGANLDIYKYLDTLNSDLSKELDNIKEDFCFLFVSHWMQGDVGEDRKNVGLLIKAFFEIFKDKEKKPALILKTCGAVSSYMDRDAILNKIHSIKKTCNTENLPNIYLLHGDFKDEEMNELYNHPKVKAMVCLTKGEGFGRSLLEFSLLRKPIITTNWSGHTDFLLKDLHPLIGGELKNIHPSAVTQFLLAESQWFNPNLQEIGVTILDVFNNYKKHLSGAKQQSYLNKEKFSFDSMKDLILSRIKKFPEFSKQIQLVLPKIDSLVKFPTPKFPKSVNFKRF